MSLKENFATRMALSTMQLPCALHPTTKAPARLFDSFIPEAGVCSAEAAPEAGQSSWLEGCGCNGACHAAFLLSRTGMLVSAATRPHCLARRREVASRPRCPNPTQLGGLNGMEQCRRVQQGNTSGMEWDGGGDANRCIGDAADAGARGKASSAGFSPGRLNAPPAGWWARGDSGSGDRFSTMLADLLGIRTPGRASGWSSRRKRLPPAIISVTWACFPSSGGGNFATWSRAPRHFGRKARWAARIVWGHPQGEL